MDRSCELCQGRASVYCAADEAYVCWDCDAKVHGANFIVARHARSILCQKCQSPTVISAGSCAKKYPLCPTCTPTDLEILAEVEDQAADSEQSSTDPSENDNEEEDEVSTINMDTKCGEDMSVKVKSRSVKVKSSNCRSRSSSPDSVIFASNRHLRKRGDGQRRLEVCRSDSSSDSQSSSGCLENHSRRAKAEQKGHSMERNSSAANSRTEERLEAVLQRWNRHLGLRSSHIIPAAMHLIRRVAGLLKSHRLQRLDARVALAACLWVAIKLDSSPTIAPRVDRFERCTGVSAEVLLAVEAKFRQALGCFRP